MNTYKDKYIKYKKKYIEIKNRIKGGTHDETLKKIIEKYINNEIMNKDRFKSILRNFIETNYNISVSGEAITHIIDNGYEDHKNTDLLYINIKDLINNILKYNKEQKQLHLFNISLDNHDNSIVLSYLDDTEEYKLITKYLKSNGIEILTDKNNKNKKIIYTKKYSLFESLKRPVINGERDTGINIKEFIEKFKLFTINNKTYTIKIKRNDVLLEFLDDDTKKIVNKYINK